MDPTRLTHHPRTIVSPFWKGALNIWPDHRASRKRISKGYPGSELGPPSSSGYWLFQDEGQIQVMSFFKPRCTLVDDGAIRLQVVVPSLAVNEMQRNDVS